MLHAMRLKVAQLLHADLSCYCITCLFIGWKSHPWTLRYLQYAINELPRLSMSSAHEPMDGAFCQSVI